LDRSDSRYWELIYPCGTQRGGDAPSLEPRELGEVTNKYKISVSDQKAYLEGLSLDCRSDIQEYYLLSLPSGLRECLEQESKQT
jgi:hypothetical protein